MQHCLKTARQDLILEAAQQPPTRLNTRVRLHQSAT